MIRMKGMRETRISVITVEEGFCVMTSELFESTSSLNFFSVKRP